MFYQNLYRGFKELAEMYPDRIITIDASGDKFQTKEIIQGEMDRILAQREK